uniref:Uncharacterized protein n=1 Tax=Meloidogyne hapla TaxID=6305 RepID=A0A1I8AZB4_MELHA
MNNLIFIFFVVFAIFSTTFGIPIKENDKPEFSLKNEENENVGNKLLQKLLKNKKDSKDVLNVATCYDSRLANFINNGLYYYSHNMGQLSNYILNQAN